MIIGNGNIAKAIDDNDKFLFFTSGVADFNCVDEKQFQREKDLLFIQSKKQHLVYFSSLAIYYNNDNKYIQHKKNMEEIIRNNFHIYTIVRLDCCEWVTNYNVIYNYFRRKIKANEEVVIQDTFRYVISLSEFKHWVSLIPIGVKNEMNIQGEKKTIHEIYNSVKNESFNNGISG